ncbi:CBD9-like protein [Moniliophthora roreri MCA 2997]|nr:CBD9-like protein [Moniliophthora roreri MCA 2997]
MGVTALNLASGSSGSRPLSSFEKKFVAHAILCTLGFLLFLPIGALLARYFRTFTPVWFKAHWAIQVFAGTVIISGVAVGIQGVSDLGGTHLDDTHMRLGVALFVLYFVQCFLGAIIHFIKPSKFIGRPPQNYLHAVLGLTIIALALYQVRTGYRQEWPKVSGRGAISNGANIIWYIWVVLLPVLYFVGLAFLPKQLRQEKESRAGGKIGGDGH